MEMTPEREQRILELLRHQVPDPNLAVQDNPVVLYLDSLLDRIAELEGLVPAVLSVELSATDPFLQFGVDDTEVITATVDTQGGASDAVTWTSDDETVATVAAGTVTAVAEGTATITATSDFDPTVSGSIEITVSADLALVSSVPADGAIGVTSGTDTITVTFSEDIALTDDTLITVTSSAGVVDHEPSVVVVGEVMTITLANPPLIDEGAVLVTIPVASVEAFIGGAVLAAEETITFTMETT